MQIIKLRYNTEQKNNELIWRVIMFVDGIKQPEKLVDEVNIFTHSTTTMDQVGPDTFKAHITITAIRSVLYDRPVPKKDKPQIILDIW